jgi:protein-S-isoprenylcysteine O-methyltransferase Ste14
MACSAPGQTRKRMMPPTYFLMGLVVVVASRFVLAAWSYFSAVTLVLGAAALAGGVALNLLTDSAFKKRGTPVSPDATPSAFVASGAFRLSRNPMYLGMVLIVAGVALLVGEPIGLLAAAALILIMDRSFVPGEEHNLEAAFGQTYVDYKAAVRRWI